VCALERARPGDAAPVVPQAKIGFGPSIEDGFYYDFDIGRPFAEDLEAISEDAGGGPGRLCVRAREVTAGNDCRFADDCSS
jgi:hypothetical protein